MTIFATDITDDHIGTHQDVDNGLGVITSGYVTSIKTTTFHMTGEGDDGSTSVYRSEDVIIEIGNHPTRYSEYGNVQVRAIPPMPQPM